MQGAAISPSLLPNILEQVFERYSCCSSQDQGDKETLLLDLHKLLGRRLVPAALHILDHQTIVIYINNPKTVEIAEICDIRPHRWIRMFLHINYCTCEYFKEKVLVKEACCTAPYICQHILAVRLAITLQHKCLQYKEVPSHNLDLLLNSFINTNSEVG